MADTKRPLRVFLCHASGDKAAVLKIYERLVKDEVDAWLDSKKLIPGQNWQNEISKAVINSDIVIVCLSPHSITKEGFVQKEIRFALDVADEKPENTIFIIPAKLEVCDVPERLNRFQWVDLFSDEGYDRLIQALVLRADKVGAQIKQKKNQVKIPMGSQPRSKESANSKPTFGNAPPPPSLIVGREDTLRDIKTRLTVTSALVQAVTTVHGWPGVGKTTIAAALAHDPEISVAFPDGILWASLGTAPDIFHELSIWNRTLGVDNLMQINSIQELSAQLSALLRNKRILLILDDVWEPEHATPFIVGGSRCAMFITTRENRVAQALAPTANDIYKLAVLTEEKGLELLQKLAPTVVFQYSQSSLELVRELEGLPLALQVAGRMLNAERTRGFGIDDLLADIKTGAKLLKAQSPANRIGVAGETSFSVAALLQKSTDRLDPHSRDCFAYLGAFAPKPATFDMAAMKAVWQLEDPRPTVGTLVDRGLLEFIPETQRYWMHSLLVMHADSLLTD